MGIFGGEKYSKEGYESAERKLKEKKDIEKNVKEYSVPKRDWLNTTASDNYHWVPRLTHDDTVEAKKRLEKIYAKGRVEAIALNEEYDILLDRASEALKAVADFEREKLGMHKEGAEKVDADKK